MTTATSIIVAAFVTLGFAAYRNVDPKIVHVEVPVEVPEKERTFKEYLEESARAYGVPMIIAQAMIAQESEATKAPLHALRFESGKVKEGTAAALKLGLKGSIDFEEQVRQFASSHCSLQVMGYHAAEAGEMWTVLHDPRGCAEYGMRIFSNCLERHKAKPVLERTYSALKCYNGSDKYAREVLNRIGGALLREQLRTQLKQ